MPDILCPFCRALDWPALVPALIIIGWVVQYGVTRSHRKGAEINKLISEKNDILDEIELLARKVWLAEQPNPKDEACGLLAHKIDSMRKKYRELTKYCKLPAAWESNVGKLRKSATLDVERASGMEEADRKQRMCDISDWIEELEKFPQKKF